MRSGWVAPAGPDLDALRARGRRRVVGRAHAVALSSGTAALHLALVSWGVGPGDVVPVSTLTFAASVNAICYTGATPWFVDCEPESGQHQPRAARPGDPRQLRDDGPPGAVRAARGPARHVRRPRRRHGGRRAATACACSPTLPSRSGSSRDGRPAPRRGDAAVLSFNGNKVMTTSGGGMLVTDDADLAAARAQAVHPGPGAGEPLRAHRGRLQLPALQHPRGPRSGPAGPAGRDDRAPPGVAPSLRRAWSPTCRACGCWATRRRSTTTPGSRRW